MDSVEPYLSNAPIFLVNYGWYIVILLVATFLLWIYLLKPIICRRNLMPQREPDETIVSQNRSLEEARKKLQEKYDSISSQYKEKEKSKVCQKVNPEVNQTVRRRFTYDDGSTPLSRSSGSSYRPPRCTNTSGG